MVKANTSILLLELFIVYDETIAAVFWKSFFYITYILLPQSDVTIGSNNNNNGYNNDNNNNDNVINNSNLEEYKNHKTMLILKDILFFTHE